MWLRCCLPGSYCKQTFWLVSIWNSARTHDMSHHQLTQFGVDVHGLFAHVSQLWNNKWVARAENHITNQTTNTNRDEKLPESSQPHRTGSWLLLQAAGPTHKSHPRKWSIFKSFVDYFIFISAFKMHMIKYILRHGYLRDNHSTYFYVGQIMEWTELFSGEIFPSVSQISKYSCNTWRRVI